MLNYCKADLYRIGTRFSFVLWCFVLIAVPALLIIGVGSHYAPSIVVQIVPGIMYAAFFFITLIITEFTFREDMQLGLYKNDTTSGITRTTIFISKYFSGLLLLLLMWILCSASAVASVFYSFGTADGNTLLQEMVSTTMISYFLSIAAYLALFQMLSVLIQKTASLILVCILCSTVLSNISHMLGSASPGFSKVLTSLNPAVENSAPSVTIQIVMLTIPVICILMLLLIGSFLFRKKEL
ncbi:hypothetical protein A8L34_07515 [Bacillus sp. FJAT-27264]|uniref:ABC transporter permease n=1 Tax=Paenibacillus sp. (strain DSM 101736 / FJAT-27264) TaxID=1850362 RepID=UPI00080815EB|nr:ABC transporter permease [Bacillus sp. FJAT-27264]OBZ19348.1 hypothetical protein A8L34_07515 [Bacillus sp. FJAT-27264]